jgi:hypothetical protein
MHSAASDSHARHLIGNFVSEGVSNIFQPLLITASQISYKEIRLHFQSTNTIWIKINLMFCNNCISLRVSYN